MSPFPTSEEPNPYAPSSDWRPGQDTFTAQAAGIWAEGFAACRAAFDAVVAERDRQFAAIRAEWNVLIAERDAAITAGQKLADAAQAVVDCYPSMVPAQKNARCDAALTAWRSVSGSSEPRKETT